jgi:AraC family transcriptional regulator
VDIIRRAIALLHEHPGCPPSVNDLVRVAGLSRAHFFALFHQHIRVTPHVYANTLRMEAAYHALPDASTSLAQIARALGFAAQSHFSRFFRNHLSFSPAQYRRVVRLA